jgi:hypothetical protein
MLNGGNERVIWRPGGMSVGSTAIDPVDEYGMFPSTGVTPITTGKIEVSAIELLAAAAAESCRGAVCSSKPVLIVAGGHLTGG